MNLVEFEYDTWKRFRVSLYYVSGQKEWPLEIVRKIKRDQDRSWVLGIAKMSDKEKVILFDPEDGKGDTCSGEKVKMDLDNPWFDGVKKGITFRRFFNFFGYVIVMMLSTLLESPRLIFFSKSEEFYIFPSISLAYHVVFLRWMKWRLEFRIPLKS